jgi:hypothetical protein
VFATKVVDLIVQWTCDPPGVALPRLQGRHVPDGRRLGAAADAELNLVRFVNQVLEF